MYTIDALSGHNVALRTAEIIHEVRDKPHWILPANADLPDIPQRIAQLPFVEFYKAFRLPHEDLDEPLQTHDCVVEVSTLRFWVRASYSPSAPANGALLNLCSSANLPPWRGEIAVIALGKKTPFLKTANPVAAHKALVKCVGLMQLMLMLLFTFFIGSCGSSGVGLRTTNLSQLLYGLLSEDCITICIRTCTYAFPQPETKFKPFAIV
jgi:hypothetical protein